MKDAKFYVVDMAITSHRFSPSEPYNELMFPFRQKPAQIRVAIECNLQGSGNFTEYLKEDNTVDVDKLGMAIFTGEVKLEFTAR